MPILVRLEPDIYHIAWRCMTRNTGQLSCEDGWDETHISMLEAHDGLDAFTALLLPPVGRTQTGKRLGSSFR